MNIITTNNELFQTELVYHNSEIYLLYHSEEISLLIHAISDFRAILRAYASLYGAASCIFLSHGSREEGRYTRNGAYEKGAVAYVPPTILEGRHSRNGAAVYILPTIIEGPPTLGEIPCHYRHAIRRTLELFTSRTVTGHEHLQRKLREAITHLCTSSL